MASYDSLSQLKQLMELLQAQQYPSYGSNTADPISAGIHAAGVGLRSLLGGDQTSPLLSLFARGMQQDQEKTNLEAQKLRSELPIGPATAAEKRAAANKTQMETDTGYTQSENEQGGPYSGSLAVFNKIPLGEIALNPALYGKFMTRDPITGKTMVDEGEMQEVSSRLGMGSKVQSERALGRERLASAGEHEVNQGLLKQKTQTERYNTNKAQIESHYLPAQLQAGIQKDLAGMYHSLVSANVDIYRAAEQAQYHFGELNLQQAQYELERYKASVQLQLEAGRLSEEQKRTAIQGLDAVSKVAMQQIGNLADPMKKTVTDQQVKDAWAGAFAQLSPVLGKQAGMVASQIGAIPSTGNPFQDKVNQARASLMQRGQAQQATAPTLPQPPNASPGRATLPTMPAIPNLNLGTGQPGQVVLPNVAQAAQQATSGLYQKPTVKPKAGAPPPIAPPPQGPQQEVGLRHFFWNGRSLDESQLLGELMKVGIGSNELQQVVSDTAAAIAANEIAKNPNLTVDSPELRELINRYMVNYVPYALRMRYPEKFPGQYHQRIPPSALSILGRGFLQGAAGNLIPGVGPDTEGAYEGTLQALGNAAGVLAAPAGPRAAGGLVKGAWNMAPRVANSFKQMPGGLKQILGNIENRTTKPYLDYILFRK